VTFDTANCESTSADGHGLTDYGFYLVGTDSYHIHNVTIRNMFINQCTTGIHARYVDGLLITNNRFRGTKQNGTQGYCTDIQNCTQVLYDDLNTWDNDNALNDFYPPTHFGVAGNDDPRITRVRMYNNSDPEQSIPSGLGTWTTVELGAKNWDVGASGDVNNDKVTNLYPGYYRVTGCVTFVSPVDAKLFKVAIYIDASQKCQSCGHSGSTSNLTVVVTDIIKISALTEAIYLKVDQNSGVAETIKSGTNRTWLTVERINLLEE
jgi:hypothetical protein